MKKQVKRILLVFLSVALVWMGMLVFDRNTLQKELVRLHVVGASDSAQDQHIKLAVRDAVLESLKEGLEQVTDVEAAVRYIQEHLPAVEAAANRALSQAGVDDRVKVSLDYEAFSQRIYDTFRLPSGIYRSLRVIIGEGEGHNWWCVVFPRLCVPATAEAFSEEAEESGIRPALAETLSGKEGYNVRFFFLDLMGKVENFLWNRK